MVLLRRLVLVAVLTIRLWLMVHGCRVSVPLLLVLDLVAELVVFVALVAVFLCVVIFVVVIFFVLFLILLIFFELIFATTESRFLLDHSVGVGRAAARRRDTLLLALHLLAL